MRHKKEQNYEDIICLPRHISPKHPQMSLWNRAAQFSPFAALTGHGAAIRETARLTDTFMELNEDQKEYLDEQLRLVRANLSRNPEIKITYFQPDPLKNGGAYATIQGKVKRIDAYSHQILFLDGTAVPISSVFSLDIMED